MSPKSKGWTDPAEEPARRDDATPLSEIVGGLLGRRPFVRGVAVGRLARSWPDVVGERLAHETRPARLDAGTLTVQATSGPWGSQAQFLAEAIRERANELLGSDEVKRVQVQVGPGRGDRPKPL